MDITSPEFPSPEFPKEIGVIRYPPGATFFASPLQGWRIR